MINSNILNYWLNYNSDSSYVQKLKEFTDKFDVQPRDIEELYQLILEPTYKFITVFRDNTYKSVTLSIPTANESKFLIMTTPLIAPWQLMFTSTNRVGIGCHNNPSTASNIAGTGGNAGGSNEPFSVPQFALVPFTDCFWVSDAVGGTCYICLSGTVSSQAISPVVTSVSDGLYLNGIRERNEGQYEIYNGFQWVTLTNSLTSAIGNLPKRVFVTVHNVVTSTIITII